jgi:hypothetical protein
VAVIRKRTLPPSRPHRKKCRETQQTVTEAHISLDVIVLLRRKTYYLEKLSDAVRHLATGRGSLRIRVCDAYTYFLSNLAFFPYLEPGDSQVDVNAGLQYIRDTIAEAGTKFARSQESSACLMTASQQVERYGSTKLAKYGMHWSIADKLARTIVDLFFELNREVYRPPKKNSKGRREFPRRKFSRSSHRAIR